ncbi:hypothetical protein OWR29_26390 [Actinoplanes sp. Pm04-4]|uniref:Integral membrane protein n=1 Tax=Paractinoplanes pyxinae TaxID=2997416 RepID=A0ABT4B4W8_9ACTN|nr:hypothetical protein [Actinoplanes pyxinae]MCY1141542.1 hypothetical protein [Actinoplanes pyxinae]
MRTHGQPIVVRGPSRWQRGRPLTSASIRNGVILGAAASAAIGVILLSQQLLLLALTLIGAAVAALIVLASALLARPKAFVTDRRAWYDVEKWCRTILAAWPHVEGIAGIQDVASVIASARWDIARLQDEKGNLVAARDEATFAQYGIDVDDPLRLDLADRRDQVILRLTALDEEIVRRTDRLRTLAEHCIHLGYQPKLAGKELKRRRRAREALAKVDSAIVEAAPWNIRPDPTTDLSEQTAMVVVAYRELIGKNAQDPPSRSWHL